MATDRHALYTALMESARFDTAAADRLATTFMDAIRDNVATKADIAALRSEIQLMQRDLKLWLGGCSLAIAMLILAAVGAIAHWLH